MATVLVSTGTELLPRLLGGAASEAHTAETARNEACSTEFGSVLGKRGQSRVWTRAGTENISRRRLYERKTSRASSAREESSAQRGSEFEVPAAQMDHRAETAHRLPVSSGKSQGNEKLGLLFEK